MPRPEGAPEGSVLTGVLKPKFYKENLNGRVREVTLLRMNKIMKKAGVAEVKVPA